VNLRRYLPVIAGVVFALAGGSALVAWLLPPEPRDPFAAEATLPPIPEVAPRQRRPATVAEGTAVLHGCWLGSRPDGTRIEERYALDAEGVLVGKVVERAPDGRVLFFEDLRIAPARDGIRYHPRPNGEARAVSFLLESWDRGHAVFVAPQHDFPQRIAFARDGTGLTTSVTGIEGGRPKRDSYRTERSACPAG
jgi:hypothetical protein